MNKLYLSIQKDLHSARWHRIEYGKTDNKRHIMRRNHLLKCAAKRMVDYYIEYRYEHDCQNN